MRFILSLFLALVSSALCCAEKYVHSSGIPGGIYVASVCVDGKLADGTKRVIINR